MKKGNGLFGIVELISYLMLPLRPLRARTLRPMHLMAVAQFGSHNVRSAIAVRRAQRVLHSIFLFLLFSYSASVFSQQKSSTPKADSYFNNNEFVKAIPLYEKAADKDDEALRKLADCHRMLKNYPMAELYYGKLVAKQTSEPMVYYYYGAALLSNNKYDEAKRQFSVYSILSPDDNRGELYAKVCDRAKELAGKPALYEAYNLQEANTPVADFSPAFYPDGLVFSSEKIKDLVNFSQSSGNPFLSLVFSKGEKKRNADTTKASGKDSILYSDAKLFSDKLSSGGHYGPACFSADFSEIYFMKVEDGGKKGKVNQPKIFYSKNKNGWTAPEVLSFCSDLYATGHPSLSKDGQFLYFISNMPGGWGGLDIWVSKREGEAWGVPKNLGKEINTAEDEAYPYISAENVLYFSSKGHAGFGGLDIYASTPKVVPDRKTGGKWASPSNLMPPINSTANDFGIIFKDANRGYFSSNRAGGKGSDDLYGFGLSGLITTVSGKVLLSMNTADPAANVKVYLLTSKGVVVKTLVADANGFFKFENLLSDQSYMVKVDEKDPIFSNVKKLYLTDATDKVVRVATKNKDGFFVFEYLPADVNRLSEMVEQDASIAGSFYAGDERTPVKFTKVNLVNDRGEIVRTCVTNGQGSFVFMHLPSNENLTLAIEGLDPKFMTKKIYFTNKNGKEMAVANGRSCEFRILASDEQMLSMMKVEDSQVLVDFEGILYSSKTGKKPLEKTTIYLVDEKGNIVGTYQTDASGNFKFSGLPGDKTFMIKLKEDDLTLSTKDVYVADKSGRIVATLKTGAKFFRYSFLPAEEQKLAKLYFNDPWLQAGKLQLVDKSGQMTIIENIYYEYQKWDLGPQAIINLNKVAEIMAENSDIVILLMAHTDARGTAEFNAELSQKRAQVAVDYIISKGINKSRLTARGMGESKLVNRCKDGVECYEEEHAQNRRTEFRVKKGGN